MIISHIRTSDRKIQSNADHSAGVADLAESFASEFGFGSFGRAMGLLHDKGKEKQDFQNYIKTVGGIADTPLDWTDKTHAYVGALMAKKLFGPLADLVISLTEMVKPIENGLALIEKWLRNKNTVEFLGIWEAMYNPDFNSPEFKGIKNEAGLNRKLLKYTDMIKLV